MSISDVSIDIDSESEEDTDFMDFAVIIAFPRKERVFRRRVNHMIKWTNDEFLQRFRLNKEVVQFLAEILDDRLKPMTTRNHAVTTLQKILVTLRYYATGSFIYVCGDFSGLSKSTAGKVIKEVSAAIASMRVDFIVFPRSQAELREVRQQFYNISKFPNCIGALDCTHVKIRSPGGENAEIYRNRKNYFSINVQTVCDARLMIRSIVARWPGSAHDSTILGNSVIKQRLDAGEFGNGVIVADSGYAVQKRIITPLANPITQAEQLFNEAQIRTRNPIERSYGVWKRRFPILSLGINVRLKTSLSIIVATAVLYNIARRFGSDMPRVTRELEHLIQLLEVPVPNVLQVGGNRSVHRRKFLNYFNSLL